MKLFEVLPDRFFGLLSGRAKAFYADSLFLLYDLYRERPLDIPREAYVDSLAMMIEALSDEDLALLDADEEADAGTPGASVGLRDGRGPRDRASAALRRLDETGWVKVETRTDHEQIILINDYSLHVLEAFDRIRAADRIEYRGLVYGTYAALCDDAARDHLWDAVFTAYNLTEALIRELKSLYHNIKRYTERLATHRRAQDLLAAHFLEYQEQVLDRAYHQLKTSDNIAKFRPRVLNRVEEWLRDSALLSEAASAAQREGRMRTSEDAREQLLKRLHFVRQAYEGVDDLMEEIDRRNAQYVRASLEQVRYVLNSSRDTEGQLRDLLLHFAERLADGEWHQHGLLPEPWPRLWNVFHPRHLGEGSLYTPPRQRREHRPQPVEDTGGWSEERERARQRAYDMVRQQITASKINDHVLAALGDRVEMRAADLGVEDLDDFIRLIYVAAYSQNRRVQYRIDFEGERVSSAGGRFSFRNVRIRKK